MIYRLIFLYIGIFGCTSFVANAQDFKEVLQKKEPIDRFNFIIYYYERHINEPKTISNFKAFLQKEGTKDDINYFEYYAINIRCFSMKVPFLEKIRLLDSSLKKFTTQNNPFLNGSILQFKAQMCVQNNYYEKALIFNLLALNEFSKDEKKEYFKNSYFFYAAGLIFLKYKDYKKALEFGLIAHQSKYYYDPNKNENWLPKANANLIGESYKKLQKFDSAIYWHKISFSECKTEFTLDTLWKGIATSSIASVYNDLGKKQEALNLYLKSDSINKNLEIYLIDHNLNMYCDMATIYVSQKQISKAAFYLNKAFDYLPKSESHISLLNYYNSLLLFNKANNSNASTILQNVDSVNKYHALVDEDFNAKNKIQFEANMNFEKQQQALKLKEEQFKIARSQNIGLFIVAILIAIVAILYTKRKKLFYTLQQEKLTHEKETVAKSLTFAQKQLTDFNQKIQEKNELIEQFETEIGALQLLSNNQQIDKQQAVQKLKLSVILTDDDWDNYKTMFDKVHPNFSNNLKEKYPTITQAELRYLMFSKLQLSNKEMAASLGISLEGVRNLKFRVKQKLNGDFENL